LLCDIDIQQADCLRYLQWDILIINQKVSVMVVIKKTLKGGIYGKDFIPRYQWFGESDQIGVSFYPTNGAVDAGHQAEVSLFGDAVVLMKDAVANSIVPVGWPPLKDILVTTIKNKIPIYV